MEKEKIHNVYSTFLNILELSKKHKDNLDFRGLSPEIIENNKYKTFPNSKRIELVEQLLCVVDDVRGVPGFFMDKGKWTVSGKGGMLIPVRDIDGNITSLKVRSDRNISNKYTIISSDPSIDPKTKLSKYPEGTKASPMVHFPLSDVEDRSVIRITEGEIKADIVTQATGTYTIGLPGIRRWELAVDIISKLKPKKVLIAFDSDKDETHSSSNGWADLPNEVGKSLCKLYKSLSLSGFNPVIEDWNKKLGKGIDDVITDGGEEDIGEMSPEDAEELIIRILEKDPALDWYYSHRDKRFFQFSDPKYGYDKEQFRDMKGGGDPKYILEVLNDDSFLKVARTSYEPEQPRISGEEDMKVYNQWRGIDYPPIKGDVSTFLNHIEFILPDEEDRDQILKFLAFTVQNPGKKILWAPVIQGSQGTGKSYLGEMMKYVLGEDNVGNPSNDTIHEKYGSWRKNKQFIYVDEIMASGKLDLMNKLKPIITDTELEVREMAKESYKIPNIINLMFLTNHKNAILLDEDDRRYAIFFSTAKKKPQSYYNELWDWTEENFSHIRYYLENYDLSGFSPYEKPRMNDAKRQMIAESMPVVKQWIVECLELDAFPFNHPLVNLSEVVNHTPKWLQKSNIKLTPKLVGGYLAELGGINHGLHRLPNEKRVRLWSTKSHSFFAEMDTKQRSNQYYSYLQGDISSMTEQMEDM